MRFRSARTGAAVLAAPVLVGALAAPAAAGSASSPTAKSAPTKFAGAAVVGGSTKLTVDPGVAKALVSAGILPLPLTPASGSVISTHEGPTVRYAFPITDGKLDLKKAQGVIKHSGGLDFYNLANRKSLVVQNFRIVLDSSPRLTGYVPALKTRIAVFNLDLAKAKISPTKSGVRVDNVRAKLTAGAADGLNGALGTKVFAPGLKVGSASVSAQLAH